jgi:hypothetical protein
MGLLGEQQRQHPAVHSSSSSNRSSSAHDISTAAAAAVQRQQLQQQQAVRCSSCRMKQYNSSSCSIRQYNISSYHSIRQCKSAVICLTSSTVTVQVEHSRCLFVFRVCQQSHGDAHAYEVSVGRNNKCHHARLYCWLRHTKLQLPAMLMLSNVLFAGPALHAEVGDTIHLVLRNNLDFPINIMAGGVSSEGAPTVNPGDTYTAK